MPAQDPELVLVLPSLACPIFRSSLPFVLLILVADHHVALAAGDYLTLIPRPSPLLFLRSRVSRTSPPTLCRLLATS
eukprot:4979180-Pleurochrysis_carterae.AAC.1